VIDRTTLADTPLFSGLAPPAIELLVRRASARDFAADETLFSAGEPATGIYVVVAGRVRVVRDVGGRRHIVHEERAGGTLGEVPLFERGGYPATAIAAEPTRCLFVHRDVLAEALRADPELAWRLLGRLAGRVRVLVERLDRATALSVPQRVAAHLLARASVQGSHRVTLGGTQQWLAEELGTVREVVVRALRAMATAGAIRALGAGRYEIADERTLRAIADGA
jgi:CRP/FNR family transcriptional regulator